MRKILFGLIMCLLLIYTGIIITKGLEIGEFEIWGIQQIMSKNEEIDQDNADLSALASTTYQDSLKKLNNTAKAMEDKKSEYENKAVMFNDSSYYLQTEEYEIEFLWTKIGNYALDNDVEIKIEVTNSQLEGRYDLNFTVTGKYSDVTQFIYDIENDSKLGFKIEDFSMVSSEAGVQGKFSCKEIKIDIQDKDLKELNTESEGKKENSEENTDKETTENEQSENKDENTVSSETNTTTTNNTTNTQSTDTTDPGISPDILGQIN